MPANEMTISQALHPNLCSVLLGSGTEYNRGQTFTQHVKWTYAGAPGMALTLPFAIPPCDWASIVVNFHGCTAGPFLQPQGVPRPLWAPPPPSPFVVPNTYVTSSLAVAPSPGAIINAAVAMVNVHPPYTAMLGAPNAFDAFTSPGNTYEMEFVVTLIPGIYGLKTWVFEIGPGGEKIAVVCDVVDPAHQGSE